MHKTMNILLWEEIKPDITKTIGQSQTVYLSVHYVKNVNITNGN